jgi:drug/metabolite transporter (DMT)-like permease
VVIVAWSVVRGEGGPLTRGGSHRTLANCPMPPSATRARIVLAFAAVYVIWGSTYLGIRYAIETIPPLLMAGVRFILAGGILYGYARATGAKGPERRHWLHAAVIGALMLLGGNGLVVLSERSVPSSLAALVIASTPLWMALFEGLHARTGLPRGTRLVALFLGFAAVAFLVGPDLLNGGNTGRPLDFVLLLCASPAWVIGTLYSRRAPRPSSSALATAMQMMSGGAILLAVGTLLGEWSGFQPERISAVSFLAFLYLVLFGSLIAFTAYAWLIQVVSPTMAATYAYVNPVVAVVLGWLVADEPIGVRTLIAAAGIVASVVLISLSPASRGRHDGFLIRSRGVDPRRDPQQR